MNDDPNFGVTPHRFRRLMMHETMQFAVVSICLLAPGFTAIAYLYALVKHDKVTAVTLPASIVLAVLVSWAFDPAGMRRLCARWVSVLFSALKYIAVLHGVTALILAYVWYSPDSAYKFPLVEAELRVPLLAALWLVSALAYFASDFYGARRPRAVGWLDVKDVPPPGSDHASR